MTTFLHDLTMIAIGVVIGLGVSVAVVRGALAIQKRRAPKGWAPGHRLLKAACPVVASNRAVRAADGPDAIGPAWEARMAALQDLEDTLVELDVDEGGAS